MRVYWAEGVGICWLVVTLLATMMAQALRCDVKPGFECDPQNLNICPPQPKQEEGGGGLCNSGSFCYNRTCRCPALHAQPKDKPTCIDHVGQTHLGNSSKDLSVDELRSERQLKLTQILHAVESRGHDENGTRCSLSAQLEMFEMFSGNFMDDPIYRLYQTILVYNHTVEGAMVPGHVSSYCSHGSLLICDDEARRFTNSTYPGDLHHNQEEGNETQHSEEASIIFVKPGEEGWCLCQGNSTWRKLHHQGIKTEERHEIETKKHFCGLRYGLSCNTTWISPLGREYKIQCVGGTCVRFGPPGSSICLPDIEGGQGSAGISHHQHHKYFIPTTFLPIILTILYSTTT